MADTYMLYYNLLMIVFIIVIILFPMVFLFYEKIMAIMMILSIAILFNYCAYKMEHKGAEK